MAVLPSRVANGDSKAHSPSLDPQSIIRAAVYIQGALRRFLVEDAAQLLDISPPVPPPPVAVAVFFARRLLHPLSGWPLEEEAMGVAAVICGRERGLTLGPITKAYDEYSGKFPAGHPVSEMLKERFREVAVEAEETLLHRLQDKEIPSEGYACFKEFCQEWGVPETPIDGHPILERAKMTINGLKPAMEEKLTKSLDYCQTMAGFLQLEADLNRELGDGHAVLRSRIRNGKRAHSEHVKETVQSLWGWPPMGSSQPLARATRWYAEELGAEHPVVEDFSSAVMRIVKKAEDSMNKELEPIDKKVAGIRHQLFGSYTPPPKLVCDALNVDLQELMVTAMDSFMRWQQEFGCESHLLFAFMRSILGDKALVERCEAEASSAAEVLRRHDPGPFAGSHGATEMEERLAASVRLCQLKDALGDLLASSSLQAMSVEFASELARAQPKVPLQRPGTPDSAEDDGWHAPPSFERVERPAVVPGPGGGAARAAEDRAAEDSADAVGTLPELKAETPPPEPEPPGDPPVTVRMRLHGVDRDDTRSKSELLLIEKCAGIIAEECGIPREWVSQVAFAEPPPKATIVGPPVADLDGAEEFELSSGGAVRVPGSVDSVPEE